MDYAKINWTLIFQKPVCQLDNHGCFLHQTTADLDIYAKDGSYIMPAGCIDAAPPETKAGFAAQWQPSRRTSVAEIEISDGWQPENGEWVYIEDHRGQTAYDTTTGEAVPIAELGALPQTLTLKPKPSEYHVFNPKTNDWQIDRELRRQIEQQQFQAARADKIVQLNAAAQSFIAAAAGTDKVPDFEIQTWAIQAAEAKAWAADNTAATPVLDTIAANRGIPRTALIQAALKKTLQYEALTAAVAGQRQALQTQIEAAKTIDEVNAVEITFRLPENQGGGS